MATIGSNDWLNIVSLIDREQGPACYNYIEKGKVTKIKDAGELDMGDYRVMVDFMKWVRENYPAKKYILTVWNHGSGWKYRKTGIYRGVSYDDQSGNHITNAQLTIALKEIKGILGKNIDILNFDACLMQMAEVVHACKDYVDYIVASEETEPGAGTPYGEVFAHLTPTITAEAFCKKWVKAFIGSYSKSRGSQGIEACTQSAIKCAKFDGVLDAINGFAKAAMAGKYAKEFAGALLRVQKFSYPENIDLIHLAKLIKAVVKDEGMQTACDKLISATQAAVVANGNAEATMRNAFGLAIYFPADQYGFESHYKDLDFCKVTLWDEMIQDFYAKHASEQVVAAIESGDLSTLREYVSKASAKNRSINRAVVKQLNFRLHSEGGLSKSLVDEANNLVKELFAK
jgi:hypothetical protein